MELRMTEAEFVKWLVTGNVQTILGDKVYVPENFYKRHSGEINAEKIMMVVLKARSEKRAIHLGIPTPSQPEVA